MQRRERMVEFEHTTRTAPSSLATTPSLMITSISHNIIRYRLIMPMVLQSAHGLAMRPWSCNQPNVFIFFPFFTGPFFPENSLQLSIRFSRVFSQSCS